MEWEEPAVCAGPLLKVRLCEPGERLTSTAPAQSIKKSNQRMFARIPNQIMSDERSAGFNSNLLSWGTNSSIMSLIGEHIAISHSLKDSSAHLSRSLSWNLNKIFSNSSQPTCHILPPDEQSRKKSSLKSNLGIKVMIRLARQRCLHWCWVKSDGQDREPLMPLGVGSAVSLSFARWRCRKCASCCAAGGRPSSLTRTFGSQASDVHIGVWVTLAEPGTFQCDDMRILVPLNSFPSLCCISTASSTELLY